MSPFSTTYDVLILGAGPAGLTAALRLLEMGYCVGMIERERFPRPQIGESLSPGIRNIFTYLQAEHLLWDPAYLTQLLASVCWENEGEIHVRTGDDHAGIVVDRSKLDQELLTLAISNGLALLQPATLQAASNTPEGWQLSLQVEGSVKTCFSRVVLDARGRNGAPFRDRMPLAPLLVAIWAHFQAGHRPKEAVVEAVDQGWLWASSVARDQFRIMAFTDAGSSQKKPSQVLADMIKQTTLLAEYTDRIGLDRIKTCAVASFVHRNPWHNQFIKLGEAAFTLDPLSSTGVEKAMRFSLQTAIAINTFFKQPYSVNPISFYEENLIDAVVTHARWTKGYYAQAWPAKKETSLFWQKRINFQPDVSAPTTPFVRRLQTRLNQSSPTPAQNPPAAIPINSILQFLWDKPVQLSPLLIIRNTFSISNDLVEEKEAIHHPALNTPLRYVDQIDIVPLLTNPKWTTLGDFVQTCNRVMPLEQAKKIAAFLWYRNILVTV